MSIVPRSVFLMLVLVLVLMHRFGRYNLSYDVAHRHLLNRIPVLRSLATTRKNLIKFSQLSLQFLLWEDLRVRQQAPGCTGALNEI